MAAKYKIELQVGLHRTKVRPWDDHLRSVLSEVLAYELPKRKQMMNAMNRSKYGGSGDPKRFQTMVHHTGSFKSGLLADALHVFANDPRLSEYEVTVSHLKTPPPLDVDGALERLDKIPFTPRDYQMDAILTALEQVRGVIAIPTGGGKSVVLSGVAAALNLKTIIVVESKDLAEQLVKEVAQATGLKVGRLWTGAVQVDEPIVVCLRNTLARRLKAWDGPWPEWAKSIGCIIVDECHHVTGESYDIIFENLPNAAYRFGFTATPEGSSYDGEEEVVQNGILIKANIGPTIYRLKMSDLITQGYLAKPEIRLIENVPLTKLVSTDYNLETEIHIVNNDERNLMGCYFAKQAYDAGENVIVFVKRVAHGEIVHRMLLDQGVKADEIAYITGETGSSDRKEEIANFADGKTKILIGTVLTEGLNFVVSTGVNLGGGRAGRYIVQALGRVLRKPKASGKDVDVTSDRYVTFYDFCDGGHILRSKKGELIHPILRKHGKIRTDRYESEGHVVQRVQPPLVQTGDYSI